jgi:hypothetical protein
MLDVRRLRLLRELAARRTVTAVADALNYTPSAVSQQLAALERDAPHSASAWTSSHCRSGWRASNGSRAGITSACAAVWNDATRTRPDTRPDARSRSASAASSRAMTASA